MSPPHEVADATDRRATCVVQRLRGSPNAQFGDPVNLFVPGRHYPSLCEPKTTSHPEGRRALMAMVRPAADEQWLLISWAWEVGCWLERDHHLKVLLRDEDFDDGYEIRWFPFDVPIQGRWAKKRLQSIQCHLSKDTMHKMASVVGGFEGRGRWFFSRLLPRRLPAALRAYRDHLQLWVRL